MAIILPSFRGLFERGRTLPAGEVSTAWDNAWLTTTIGSITAYGSCSYKWCLIGKAVFLSFWLNCTMSAGGYSVQLRTPNSWAIKGSNGAYMSHMNNGATWIPGHVYGTDTTQALTLSHYAGSVSYTGSCGWIGQIWFEVY